MPGTLVRMGLKSPRTLEGASGFGSQMSMWLGSLQVDHEHLLGRSPAVLGLAGRRSGALGLFGLKAEDVGQAEAEQAGTAEPHEFAAIEAVAGGARKTGDGDHEWEGFGVPGAD